jgi:peptide deformylase
MPIVQTGEEVLRRRASEIPPGEIRDPEFERLVAALRHALVETPGVGNAAPQIGVPLRVVLIQDLAEFHQSIPAERLTELERAPIDPYVLINPELQRVGRATRTFFEGCLSVGEGKFRALVERHHQVRVRYFDAAGSRREEIRTGWHARILQHEVDHLDGVLYVDKMLPRTFMTGDYERWADAPTAEVFRAFEGAP